MTILQRVTLKLAQAWRSAPQTIHPPPRACSRDLCLLCHRSVEQSDHSDASQVQLPKIAPHHGTPGVRHFMCHLIGFFGGPQVAQKLGCPVLTFNIMSEIVKKQIEDRLKSKGIQPGTYAKYTVSVEGQKVAIKFQIPPSCEAQLKLTTNIGSNFWSRDEENGGGGSVSYSYWTSGLSCYLMIIHQEKKKKTEGNQGEVNEHERDLHILITRSALSYTRKADNTTQTPSRWR